MVHIRDAASATAAALDHGEPGVYNVVDDEPDARRSRSSRSWQRPSMRSRPATFPAGSARLLGGEAAVMMMTEIRGASNAKAKRELGWELRYPSWRLGFQEGLR